MHETLSRCKANSISLHFPECCFLPVTSMRALIQPERIVLEQNAFLTGGGTISRGIFVFDGEKTHIFWSGLFILGTSLFVLFTVLWFTFITYHDYPVWRYSTPFAFGSAVFLVIGFYMTKTGLKRKD